MVWNLLAPIAGSVVGGLFQSGAQKSASGQQAQTAREGLAAQQAMNQQNLDFQREMLGQQAMANFPRQGASNAALQQITDLYGLGDIYAAPTPGSMAGPANFYPGANIPGAQGMGGVPAGQLFQPPQAAGQSYLQANPDVMQYYQSNPQALAMFGGDMNVAARHHYDTFGRNEGRQWGMY